MSKSVPLSVRVTEDDAEFIAGLEVAGAATPSDKVRALLQEARRSRERFRDYPGCLSMIHEMLAPTLHQLRQAEHRQQEHSELIAKVSEWLPEVAAFLLTGLADADEASEREALEDLERGIADRVFRLTESVLRMGVTRTCRGYDPAVISDRTDAIVELAGMIRENR